MSRWAVRLIARVLRAVANSNAQIGVVIRVEELHGKDAASLEKLEHGNSRKFANTRDDLAGPARLGPHRR